MNTRHVVLAAVPQRQLRTSEGWWGRGGGGLVGGYLGGVIGGDGFDSNSNSNSNG